MRGHLQWVPTHCDLPGNERADALAKEASELPQQDVPPDTAAVVKAVARDARKAWAASWRPSLHRDIMKGKIPAPVEEPTAVQSWTCISSGPATGRAPGNTCTGLENYRRTTEPSVRTLAARPASVWSVGRRPTPSTRSPSMPCALVAQAPTTGATNWTATVSRTPAWWPTSPLATGPSRASRLLRTELLLEGATTTTTTAGHGSGQPTTGGSAYAHSADLGHSPGRHQGLVPGLAGPLIPKDRGGGGNAEAGPRGGPRGGGGCSPTAGSTSHWSRFRQYLHRIRCLPRRHAPGVVPGGALPRMLGRGGHAGARVAPLPVSGWSASQNTRHHLHDTDAAAGRRRRRRLGPRPQTRRSR